MPPEPEGLSLNLWYDLSPMRPDAFAEQNAARWNTAMVDRAAYQKGIEQARKESAGAPKVAEMLASREGPPEA